MDRVPPVCGPTLATMFKPLVERRLAEVGTRLRALRDELKVIDEQFIQLADEAEDTRLRAMVSETPVADREFRDAQRHADAMRRRRADVVASIAQLEARQDELLDRLIERR
jgi:hypothetical protein